MSMSMVRRQKVFNSLGSSHSTAILSALDPTLNAAQKANIREMRRRLGLTKVLSTEKKKQLEERYEQCRNELESKKEQFRLMHKFLKSDSNGREAIALEAMALYNSSRDRLVALVKEAGEIRNKLEEA